MKLSILALFFVGASGTQAQAVTHLSQEVRIIDPSQRFLKKLSHQPELVIDHVSPLGYEVYGPSGLQAYLNSQFIPYLASEKQVESVAAEYPSPEATLNSIQNLAETYPSLITLIEIGKSVEGRALTFVRVTAPGKMGKHIAERLEFKYVANMHGDEIVGRELMLKLIEDLASNYGKDQRVTSLLENVQVYIMPSMNPDGAAHRVRYNANGTDLNRSFPDFTTSDQQNTTSGREPEIQAMMKFQAAHHFKLSANFHGGAEVVNYPWDTQAKPFPLDNLVKKLSLDYSKKVPYIYNSSQFKEGITNGYAWYEVDGGMQDWSYHWHHDLQLTIELTQVKWPAYSSVKDSYFANRDALLTLIEDIAQF